MNIKYLSLIILVIQNTAQVLVMRYTRTIPGDKYKYKILCRYLTSTAVVFSELFKLITCILMITYQEKSVNGMLKRVKEDIIDQPRDTLLLIIPSGLYTLQNNLLYIALSNLDAATYQVTYQLKILTTALFSVLVLGKHLTGYQWISLVILTGGVALVQPKGNAPDPAGGIYWWGMTCVIISSLTSGFAGVYFEKLLKGAKSSIWIRNIQLSVFSLIFCFMGIWYKERAIVSEKGFLIGYNNWVWLCISIQAFGGLVVAVVIKYADNILKGFATSVSIVLSCILAIFLFNFHVTFVFAIGTILVIIAVFLYGTDVGKVCKDIMGKNIAN